MLLCVTIPCYLCYNSMLLCVISAKAKTAIEQTEVSGGYKELKAITENWLKRNAYSEVNLNRLFEGLFSGK